MATSLTISASNGSNGDIRLTPVIVNEPVEPLIGVTVLINDISAASGFIEKELIFKDSNDTPLTIYVLDNTIIQTGTSYMLKIVYSYSARDDVHSEVINITAKSIPVKPVLLNSVRPEDGGVSVNLLQYGTIVSSSDGYDRINKIIIYIAKINSTQADDFYTKIIDVSSATSYDKWYSVISGEDSPLTNGAEYEIAYRVVNNVGQSILSDTKKFTPADVPSKLTTPAAFAKLNNEHDTSDISTGEIIVYWSKPEDNLNLIRGERGVTKYVIYEYEQTKDDNNNWVNLGAPILYNLMVPASMIDPEDDSKSVYVEGAPDYELTTPIDIGDTTMNFQYSVSGTPGRLGKVYKYRVIAENLNGSSPISDASDNVSSYMAPDIQSFEIYHETEDINTTGTTVTETTGNLKFQINDLSDLNGTDDIISELQLDDNTTIVNRTLKLEVFTQQNLSNAILSRHVIFTQAYTQETIDDVTTYTLEDKWTSNSDTIVFDSTFDSSNITDNKLNLTNHDLSTGLKVLYKINEGGTVIGGLADSTYYFVIKIDDDNFKLAQSLSDATNGTQMVLTAGTGDHKISHSLTSNLSNGVGYLFKLTRQGTDLFDSSKTVSSIPTTISRTQFTSPNRLTNIEAYAVNSEYEYVKTANGDAAVELMFVQLTNAQMNGMDIFLTETNPLKYQLYQGSVKVDDVEPLTHIDSDQSETRSFIYKTQVGETRNLYVRTSIANPELDGLIIQGKESSPVRSSQAQDYVHSVTDLRILESNETSFRLGWTKPSNPLGLGANNLNDIEIKIYVYNDDNQNDIVAPKTVIYSAATQQVDFDNLTTGETYKIFAVSQAKYTKPSLDGESNRFDNSIIRKNFASISTSVFGIPSVPTNVKVQSGFDSMTLLYDQPTNSGGFLLTALRYNLLTSEVQDDTFFPYTDDTSTIRQDSIVDVSGTTSITSFKSYKTLEDASNKDNATLLSNTALQVAIWATGSAGGHSLNDVTFILNEINSTPISISSAINSIVELKTIEGTVHTETERYLTGNLVTQPTITAAVAASTVTLSIDKPLSGSPSDLLVIVDYEDGLDNTQSEIVSFDTRDLRNQTDSAGNTFGDGGRLFSLESLISNASIVDKTVNSINYGSGGFDFKVVDNKYKITFTNLVNGRSHLFKSYFIVNNLGYDILSTPAEIVAAAEAPPTSVQNLIRTVDDKIVKLYWLEPENSGGAGLGNNGTLQYKIQVTNNSENVVLETSTALLYYELNENTFPDILNGTIYNIKVLPFYIKDNNNVESDPSAAPSVQAKPGASPVSPTAVYVINNGDRSVEVGFTTPTTADLTSYPLTSIDIMYKKHDEESYTLAHSITFLVASQQEKRTVASLVNGALYDFKVVSVANYQFAQSPPIVLISNITPFGAVLVTIADANVVGTAGKKRAVSAQLNGTGDITRIIALGKATNDTIVVLNLADSTLPLMVKSGIASDALAADQVVDFTLDFGDLSTSLNDILVIVNTQNGSDTDVKPTSDSFFS